MVRAGALGGSAVALAAAAHALGGGSLPSPAVLIPSVGLVALVAVVLTERKVRFAPLIVVLGLEQLLLHVCFVLGSTGSSPGASVSAILGGHHEVAAFAVAPDATGAMTSTLGGLSALMPTGPMSGSMSGPAMVVAHLVATVLTAVLIARGEAWLWSLVSRLVRRVPRPVVLPRRVSPSCARTAVRGVDQWARGSASPRGPPQWVA